MGRCCSKRFQCLVDEHQVGVMLAKERGSLYHTGPSTEYIQYQQYPGALLFLKDSCCYWEDKTVYRKEIILGKCCLKASAVLMGYCCK